MPRHARIVAAGYPMHTILRGIDRTAIFFAEPDRCLFLATLAELAAAESVGVHAYVLMTNHVHLLMTPDLPRIPSQGFQASRPKGFSYTRAPLFAAETMPMTALHQSDLAHLELIHRGKVRDIYRVDADHLLIVATDRLSAFDVVLPQPIPGKGEVLTRVANFWFGRTQGIVPNHLSGIAVADVVTDPAELERLGERAIVVRRLKALPVEAIVRGYLIGSGWKDYQRSGAVCGIALPAGLRQADRLPEAIYTPSTKAAVGAHDENVDFAHTVDLLGRELAEQVREASLRVYSECAAYALTRGIIIADTKFEFGLDADGRLHLIDEVLTPDSSRFWPADQYQPGTSPPSFDKQFVRDYLETLDWDKTPPGPNLPQEIIDKTAEKYREAERRLTGGA